jgi:hypothetical protein
LFKTEAVHQVLFGFIRVFKLPVSKGVYLLNVFGVRSAVIRAPGRFIEVVSDIENDRHTPEAYDHNYDSDQIDK